MDRLITNFLLLTAKLLNDDAIQYDLFSSAEWEEQLQFFSDQRLEGILAPLINSFKNIVFTEKVSSHKLELLNQMAFTNQYLSRDLYNIITRIAGENINCLLIKGLAIERYYKDNYRHMNDIDIFVKEDQKQQAKKALEAIGYEIDGFDGDHGMHVKYSKTGVYSVELHTALINKQFIGVRNAESWYDHVWSSSLIYDYYGIRISIMCFEDELINQIVHFGTHFVSRGVIYKNIYEIALIIKNNEPGVSWDYIEQILNDLNLLKLGKLIFCICKEIYHLDIPIDTGSVGDEFMNGFIRTLLADVTSERLYDDFKGWCIIIYRFPWMLKNNKWRPFIWFIEFFAQIKVHINPVFAFRNSINNYKVSKKKIQIIRDLDLISYGKN